MKTSLRASLAAAFAIYATALVCGTASVHAQAYPRKPVRMVVPFPPGGGTDLMARLVADKLTATLGQQVVVDNRAGAAGRIGTEFVARATPDGYTLLMATATVMVIAPALFPKLPYQSPGDFASISLLASDFYVLVVHPSVPARSVKQLIALAKARPGQLNFASSGPGDTNHLSAELFQIKAGVKMVHVPYKGAAPGTLSVMIGETDLSFSNVIPALPQIKANKLRPLGISSLKRSAVLPKVPTIAESGLPGFDVEPFYAVLAPAGTPREIVQRLNRELVKAIRSRDMKGRLAAHGTEIVGSTPEELEKMITTEISKWSKVIRQAGLKAP
ncbi:MAG: hypothetical protein A3G24_25370 [Betaproteobacteria bacterium RIFCSPLOWO2_12_FULL_62_13]|nr:MAG: hypothetical protein A3G24_25370 [Betaproteobacteria bacterium RIFCSPLOWO2_12_FULL_62_13]